MGGFLDTSVGAPFRPSPIPWFLLRCRPYSSSRPCLGDWGVMGGMHGQAGASCSGDRHGVGSSCTGTRHLRADNTGCVLALQGNRLHLCHSQETGHLSSAFVCSGGSPSTGQDDQAPQRP